jgi:hypothetical protein
MTRTERITRGVVAYSAIALVAWGLVPVFPFWRSGAVIFGVPIIIKHMQTEGE